LKIATTTVTEHNQPWIHSVLCQQPIFVHQVTKQTIDTITGHRTGKQSTCLFPYFRKNFLISVQGQWICWHNVSNADFPCSFQTFFHTIYFVKRGNEEVLQTRPEAIGTISIH